MNVDDKKNEAQCQRKPHQVLIQQQNGLEIA